MDYVTLVCSMLKRVVGICTMFYGIMSILNCEVHIMEINLGSIVFLHYSVVMMISQTKA